MQFIGEETSAINGTPELTDAPTWIVDPLDGTTNFVHRYLPPLLQLILIQIPLMISSSLGCC
jgi:hypothetical protein